MEMPIDVLLILLFTLSVLIWMAIDTIKSNKKIYKNLLIECEQIDSNTDKAELYRNIRNRFVELKERTDKEINLSLFIEEFVSEYKLDNSKKNVIQQIKLIQMRGATAILIGVLGTFMGLVFTLRKIDFEAFQPSIELMLKGIDIAFYTSILGILVSLIINYFVRNENSEHLLIQLMLKIENKLFLEEKKSDDWKIVESMQGVKESVDKMATAFVAIENFSEGFEKATENLNKFNDVFSSNTETLASIFGDMKRFTNSYNKKMEKVVDEFTSLNAFLNKQEQLQEQSLAQINGVSDAILNFIPTQNDLQQKMMNKQSDLLVAYERIEFKNADLLESVHSAATTMKDALETSSFENIAEITQQFNGSIVKMNDQLQDFTRYFNTVEKLHEEYQSYYIKVNEQIQERDDYQRTNSELMNSYIDSLSKQQSEMTHLFENTQSYHGSYIENSQSITEEMKLMIENSKQFFEDTNSSMNQQITSLNEALDEYVRISNGRLNELIDKIDGNMGESVNKSLATFERYVDTTNKILDKKIAALVENIYIQKELDVSSVQSLQKSISSLDNNIKKLSDADTKAFTQLI